MAAMTCTRGDRFVGWEGTDVHSTYLHASIYCLMSHPSAMGTLETRCGGPSSDEAPRSS